MCYQKSKGIAKRRAHRNRLNRKAETVLKRMFPDEDARKLAPYWRDNLAKCSCDMCASSGHEYDPRRAPPKVDYDDADDYGWHEYFSLEFILWRTEEACRRRRLAETK